MDTLVKGTVESNYDRALICNGESAFEICTRMADARELPRKAGRPPAPEVVGDVARDAQEVVHVVDGRDRRIGTSVSAAGLGIQWSRGHPRDCVRRGVLNDPAIGVVMHVERRISVDIPPLRARHLTQ